MYTTHLDSMHEQKIFPSLFHNLSLILSRTDFYNITNMKAISRRISTNDCNRFRWNILPNYDDYLIKGKDNIESE